MLLRPSLSFPSITEETANEQDVRPAVVHSTCFASEKDLLQDTRTVLSPRAVIDVFSIRRTRALVPRERIFRTMTARVERAGTRPVSTR